MTHLLPDQVTEAARALATERGVALLTIAPGELAAWMPLLRIGTGPRHVAVCANAHADEPGGTVTCLRYARWLVASAEGRRRAKQVTFHLLPTLNPDGLQRNRDWLGDDAGPLDWFRGVRRDLPAADREFGYGDTPAQAAHPECAAWHAYLDSLPRLDAYVNLHSMAFSGGALWLLSAPDLEATAPLRARLGQGAADRGLPLHDENRLGRKGFGYLGPGFWTTPTREAMESFLAGPTGDQRGWLRQNSVQVVRRRPETKLAVITELPLWYTPRLNDQTVTPGFRSACDEQTAQRLLDACDELARTLATSGGHADLAAEIEHRRAVAEGLARSATQWGDAPLTVGYQALGDVQVRRALLACSVWGSRLSGHDLVRRLWDWQVRDRFRSFRRRFGWRSLSLAARVALERATIEAVADEVCRED